MWDGQWVRLFYCEGPVMNREWRWDESTRRGGLSWEVDHFYSEGTKPAWDERWDGCELGGYARFEGEWEQSPVDVWVDRKTAIGFVLPSVELIYCLECVDFSILWTIVGGWRYWCARRGRNWMIEMIWRRMEGEWLVLLLCLPSRCPGCLHDQVPRRRR